MKIFEIYNGCQYYCMGKMPRIGKIIKIKKCLFREKIKLYFEDGKIEIIKMGSFSKICYGKKNIHY
jgi:hypothetical protein